MAAHAPTQTFAPGALITLAGPLAGRRFPLLGHELWIGSEAGCTISLAGDADASPRHARLTPGGHGGWTVEDLGSGSGTWVNGTRIDGPVPLYAGDRIAIGATVLVVSASAGDQDARRRATRGREAGASGVAELMAAGKAALAEQRYADALRAFESVVASSPESPDGHYGAGVALLALERLDEARARLLAALERDPAHAQARYHLGLLAEDSGDPAEAERCYRAALAIDARHQLARRQLERLLARADASGAAADAARSTTASERPRSDGTRRTMADDLDAAAAVDPVAATRGRLLVDGRRRVSSYGGRWLCVALAAAGAPVVTTAVERMAPLVPAGGLVGVLPAILPAVAALLLVSILLSAALTRYRIYERRIDFHTGVLFRRQSTLWLYDVTDVDLERGLLLLLAGTGAIALQSEARKVPRSKLRRALGEISDDGPDRIVGIASAERMQAYADHLRALVLHERRKMKERFI